MLPSSFLLPSFLLPLPSSSSASASVPSSPGLPLRVLPCLFVLPPLKCVSGGRTVVLMCPGACPFPQRHGGPFKRRISAEAILTGIEIGGPVCCDCITSRHDIMSLHHVLPSCHDIMALHHVLPPCSAIMSCHRVMTSCHFIMSCHHVMTPRDSTMPCHHVTPPRHSTIPCHHVMP